MSAFIAQQTATEPAAPSATPTAGGETGPAGLFGGYSFLLIMVAVFVFMYFFAIRPQKKEEKRRKEMLSQLKKGDSVVTSSGIIGTVATVKDETVTLRVGDNTRLEFLRSAISNVREPEKKAKKGD